MSPSCGEVRGFAGAWRDVPRLRTGPPGATACMRLRGASAGAAAKWVAGSVAACRIRLTSPW